MQFSRDSVLPDQVGQNFAWLSCWVLPKRSFKASWSLFNYVYKSGLQNMMEVISAFLQVGFQKSSWLQDPNFQFHVKNPREKPKTFSREKSTWTIKNSHVQKPTWSKKLLYLIQQIEEKIRQKKKISVQDHFLKFFSASKLTNWQIRFKLPIK